MTIFQHKMMIIPLEMMIIPLKMMIIPLKMMIIPLKMMISETDRSLYHGGQATHGWCVVSVERW